MRKTAALKLDPELFVYGRHPVSEAIKGQRTVLKIQVTKSAYDDLERILNQASKSGIEVRVVDGPHILDELAGTRDHQGVLAQVSEFPYTTLDQLLKDTKSAGSVPLILCLDQVTDPHNLGAIARVADASGATGILIPKDRSARVTAAAVKASAGALEHVKVAVCTNLARELRAAKSNSIWSYAATERAAVDWTKADFSDGTIIVLGAEGPGIRPNVLEACDMQIRIPMAGEVASLNVATVSAVLAFEVVRQRLG